MTTFREDTAFKEKVFESLESVDWLSIAVNWIRSNLNPEDVFRESDLEVWAEENGYTRE